MYARYIVHNKSASDLINFNGLYIHHIYYTHKAYTSVLLVLVLDVFKLYRFHNDVTWGSRQWYQDDDTTVHWYIHYINRIALYAYLQVLCKCNLLYKLASLVV